MQLSDNWKKLAEYPTNLLAQTHAIYLQNNGINVQTQIVDLMGLNTGGVLWVENAQYKQAQALLDNIDENAVLDENLQIPNSDNNAN